MVGALDRAGIPYMLTGSFASSYHGTPRATQDIDIVVAPTTEQIRALVQLLPFDDAAGILRIRASELDMAYIRTWVHDLGLDEQWDAARRIAGVAV
jgi:hypothetical protein